MTTRSARGRLGVGGFTLLLGLVVVLIFVGIVAIDRVLRTLADGRRHDDADRVATTYERLLAARDTGLQVLGGVRGKGAVPRPLSPDEFRPLASSYARTRGGTMRIDLFDSTGAPVADVVFDSSASLPSTMLASADVPLNTPRFLAYNDGQKRAPRLIIAQPVEGPPRTLAIATFDFTKMRGPVDSALALQIVSGRDTLAITPPPPSDWHGVTTIDETIHVPDGASWTMIVRQDDDVFFIRRGLWLFGGFTLLLLAFSVAREFRQAIGIRERSAELERLSSELLRANRMKSEFLANVSHELRTPLNAIVGFVELLKEGVYGDLSPRQVAPVDRIAASAMHLRHLVDQVLDIARIAAGRVDVQTETIALRTFVLNVASELESLFSERGLSFSISVPATLPRVRTDPTHLRQILINLLGNAVKYTPAGGVTIRARLLGPVTSGSIAERRRARHEPPSVPGAPDPGKAWVALQIVDTGIGIPENAHERIFDEFEQVNAGARGDSQQRGTGLGLAISKRIARALDGDITLESTPGAGSTFTVWLPMTLEDLRAAASPAGLMPPPASDVLTRKISSS